MELTHRRSHQTLAFVLQPAELPDLSDTHIRISNDIRRSTVIRSLSKYFLNVSIPEACSGSAPPGEHRDSPALPGTARQGKCTPGASVAGWPAMTLWNNQMQIPKFVPEVAVSQRLVISNFDVG
jgi:hypothetical protein